MTGWRDKAQRMADHARGLHGERLAAQYLEERGWTILGQRLRTPRGEVDLVARRQRTVAFVEVKWRSRVANLDLAIDERRLFRVAAAAEILAERFVLPDDEMRIDVLLLAPGASPRHITNAWQP